MPLSNLKANRINMSEPDILSVRLSRMSLMKPNECLYDSHLIVEAAGLFNGYFFECLISKQDNKAPELKCYPERVFNAQEARHIANGVYKQVLSKLNTEKVVDRTLIDWMDYGTKKYQELESLYRSIRSGMEYTPCFTELKVNIYYKEDTSKPEIICYGRFRLDRQNFLFIYGMDIDKKEHYLFHGGDLGKAQQEAVKAYIARHIECVQHADYSDFTDSVYEKGENYTKCFTDLYMEKILSNLPHKVILNVPFVEKDEAKGLGAKWDTAIKKWTIEDTHPNFALFSKWIDNMQDESGEGPDDISAFTRNLDIPITPQYVQLNVSIPEKEDAKKIGAFYSKEHGWRVNTHTTSLSKYKHWLPENNPRIDLDIPPTLTYEIQKQYDLIWDPKTRKCYCYGSHPKLNSVKEFIVENENTLRLNVSYHEEVAVSELGAFKNRHGTWLFYATANSDLEAISYWLPENNQRVFLEGFYSSKTVNRLGIMFDREREKFFVYMSHHLSKDELEKFAQPKPVKQMPPPKELKKAAPKPVKKAVPVQVKTEAVFEPLDEPKAVSNPVPTASVFAQREAVTKNDFNGADIHPDHLLNYYYREEKKLLELGAYYSEKAKRLYIPSDHPNPHVFDQWLPANNPKVYLNMPKGSHEIVEKYKISWNEEEKKFWVYKSHPKFKALKVFTR